MSIFNFIGQRQRLFKESYDLPAFLCDIHIALLLIGETNATTTATSTTQ
jgi:hypothetical protein